MIINTLNDSLIRIKNGYKLKFGFVLVLKSKRIINFLDVLYLEGFIRGYSLSAEKNKIKVLLKYTDGNKKVLRETKNISKSGKRTYVSVKNLWLLDSISKNGCFILSTSKGMMSSNRALKENIGGELLCYVA